MAGSLTVLSAHRFGRAKEELQTAELLLKNANFRSSINRSYYAIFHAIRAVNALDGFDSSKHSGVIAHFNQEYVKTGVFEKGASKIIRNASELREQADYEDFYESEIQLRRLQNTPPFSEMLTVTASGLNEAHVFQACRYVRDRLDNIIGRDGSAVVLGPAPLAVVKVNNRYRYRVIIYGKKLSGLRGIVSGLVIECCTDKRFSDVSVYADNDPAE